MTGSFNIVVVVKTVGSEQLLDFLMWTWRNFVYHRPREGYLALIFEIVQEGRRHQAVVGPPPGIGHNPGFHLIAIVGAVVHALNG